MLEENPSFRIDSEFNLKEYLSLIAQLKAVGAEQFGFSNPDIIHPTETDRSYIEDGGVWFFRAQNIRPLSINTSDQVYVSTKVADGLQKNKIKPGDVVITRTGANAGDCALFYVDEPAVASSHTFIVRCTTWPHAYLTAFLNCRYGRAQIMKGRYGAAQPEVAPPYLRNIWIPRRSEHFSAHIDAAFRSAHKLMRTASQSLVAAEQMLLHDIRLDTYTPPEALSYVRSSREALSVGRLDAEFFAPHVELLLQRLGRDGLRISDVAPARHERFEPKGDGTFDYIEIGSLGADGTASADTLPIIEAPSRATQYVRAGDVITSTVRPVRRLSALITPQQDGDVCSSGFVVLQPKRLNGEVLLTYLRLPLVCELMNLHTSATMYPAISETDLLALPIPVIAPAVQQEIQTVVRQAAHQRAQALTLLDAAKRAVEIAIEDSESAALAFLDGTT